MMIRQLARAASASTGSCSGARGRGPGRGLNSPIASTAQGLGPGRPPHGRRTLAVAAFAHSSSELSPEIQPPETAEATFSTHRAGSQVHGDQAPGPRQKMPRGNGRESVGGKGLGKLEEEDGIGGPSTATTSSSLTADGAPVSAAVSSSASDAARTRLPKLDENHAPVTGGPPVDTPTVDNLPSSSKSDPRPAIQKPVSVIHAHLSAPSPVHPKQLLWLLEDRPQLLSPAAAAALDTYSARRNEFEVRRAIRELLRRERYPGLEPIKDMEVIKRWVTVDEAEDHSATTQPSLPRPTENSLTGGQVDAGIEASKGHFVRVTDASQTLLPTTLPHGPHRIRNVASFKRYPPLSTLPNSRAVTPKTFLQYVHAQLYESTPLTLSTTINTLRDLRRSTKANEEAALHLYLAYTRESPTTLLAEFEALCPGVNLSRQSLHLAVLALLRVSACPVELDVTSTQARRLTATKEDILALIDYFKPHNRTPGPETWRHIAQYALDSDDERLAGLAFLKGRSELGLERAAAQRAVLGINPTLKAFQSQPHLQPQPQRRTRPAPVERRYLKDDPDSHDPLEVKFRNLGIHTTRFERLLHAMAERGWVKRGRALPQLSDEEIQLAIANGRRASDMYMPRLVARWVWLGRRGEAKARKQRLQKEAKLEKEAADAKLEQERLEPSLSETEEGHGTETETTEYRANVDFLLRSMTQSQAAAKEGQAQADEAGELVEGRKAGKRKGKGVRNGR